MEREGNGGRSFKFQVPTKGNVQVSVTTIGEEGGGTGKAVKLVN